MRYFLEVKEPQAPISAGKLPQSKPAGELIGDYRKNQQQQKPDGVKKVKAFIQNCEMLWTDIFKVWFPI